MQHLLFTVNLFTNGKHHNVDQFEDSSPSVLKTWLGIFSFLPIKSKRHFSVFAQVICMYAYKSALKQTPHPNPSSTRKGASNGKHLI